MSALLFHMKEQGNKLKRSPKKKVKHRFISPVFSSSSLPFSSLLFCPPAKKKKPKLLNKLDKTIKAEIDAAEKLRKKVN